MRLDSLTELIWRLYQNGKAYATNQYVLKPDIQQKCKLLFSDAIRQRYYESMKLDAYGRPDYSFVSPILSIKRYDLSPDVKNGARRCDMAGVNLYRLPRSAHFANIYPVGDCKNDEVGQITQVEPSEENFYINDPDLKKYKFYVIKGYGINTYNIPFCVKHLDIETTYDMDDDTDIDGAIASAICDQILGVIAGIKKQYYSDEAKRQIEEQNVIQ